MKYKLLKDTPTIKAGTIFEEVTSDFDELKELVRVTPIGAKTCPQFTIQDIDNFDDWFEEIKEPVDSIHWKPKIGDRYFYISGYGTVYSETWHGVPVDYYRRALGFIYPTEEECEKARERKLAKVRLQRTSTFKPDFENGDGGWLVFYNYETRTLDTVPDFRINSGEPVRYKTIEDAKKSIRENRKDWLKYFGVEED
jgi:hypothetical protein